MTLVVQVVPLSMLSLGWIVLPCISDPDHVQSPNHKPDRELGSASLHISIPGRCDRLRRISLGLCVCRSSWRVPLGHRYMYWPYIVSSSYDTSITEHVMTYACRMRRAFPCWPVKCC